MIQQNGLIIGLIVSIACYWWWYYCAKRLIVGASQS